MASRDLKALFAFLAASVPVSIASAQAPSARLDAGALYKQVSPAVVAVDAYGLDGKVRSTGTGFLISSDGKLLTNFHVIEHSKQATVRLANGDAYDTVEILAVDKRKELGGHLKIGHTCWPFGKNRFDAINPGTDLKLAYEAPGVA